MCTYVQISRSHVTTLMQNFNEEVQCAAISATGWREIPFTDP